MLRPLAACLVAWMLGGCTAAQWRREADRWAYAIIGRKQRELTGKAKPFTVEPPADTLRKRLLRGQKLPYSHPASLGSAEIPRLASWPEPVSAASKRVDPPPVPWAGADPMTISLTDALQIVARNSREYQTQKETVFQAALDLDLERQEFRNTFAGSLGMLGQTDRSTGKAAAGLEHRGALEWQRRLRTGASVTAQIGMDLVRLLTLDRSKAYGVFADATVTIPLLRGSGELVVTEPMTQAERNVVYAMLALERFKRVLAVRTASEYLGVLQQWDQVVNSGENYRRLIASGRRARRLADAGRLPEIQVDQARQDELRARNRWVVDRLAYRRRLDTFKTTLGLPTDARLEPDHETLKAMAAAANKVLEATKTKAPAPPQPVAADTPIELREPSQQGGPFEMPSEKAVTIALKHRLDLAVVHKQVADAQRGVVVAADALRAGLTLAGSAAAGGRRSLGSAGSNDATLRPTKGVYTAEMLLDLPLERTAERNAYRESHLALEWATRAAQALEDQVKSDVREALRALLGARESYGIQDEAVRLAQRRVTSTGLFLEAGRAQIRDVLEAQEALVSAQNARTAALVNYRIAELELQRDMGVLQIDEKGLWREYKPDNDE